MRIKTKSIIVGVEPERHEAFKKACKKMRSTMSRELDMKITEVIEKFGDKEGREG